MTGDTMWDSGTGGGSRIFKMEEVVGKCRTGPKNP